MFRTNRLIRYINQNRRRILFVIGAIAGLIIVIQLLNSFAKKQLSSSSIAEETNSNTESLYKPNETIITNTTVGDAQAQENSQIIDKFVEYCNNQELEKAYELLTDKNLHSKKLEQSLQKAMFLCELQGRKDGLDDST